MLTKFRIVFIVRLTLMALFGMTMLACQPLQNVKTVPTLTAHTVGSFSQGSKLYLVDTDISEIRLLVFREGPMARLGHNHVITGQVRGEIGVTETAAASGFRLKIPLDSFAVDLPAPRSEEGADFSAEVSDGARQGTLNNMLGAGLLDALQHPVIHIESTRMNGPRWNPDVVANIKLRGVSSELKFPAAVFEQNGVMTVTASFRVLQTELGLQPFSILGGAIRVRDAIDIRVRLVARHKAQ